MNGHDEMRENVAVHALGALPSGSSPDCEAAAVAQHLQTCAECRREYGRLRAAANALGYAAEAAPSPQLRSRIMAALPRPIRTGSTNVGEMRAVRPIVWPAYAVAAACLLIAIITSAFNISLSSENRQTQSQLAQLTAHTSRLTRELVRQRTALADLISPQSERFVMPDGEVVRHDTRLYIAMQRMNQPPKGKVYQAWMLHKGSTKMMPSVTFVPSQTGVAVVRLPGNAQLVAEVAVTVEPDGGSKQPTSKPSFIVKLS